MRKYRVVLSLLALCVGVIVYRAQTNSEGATIFLDGILANLADPIIWIIVFPVALIRSDKELLPVLFAFAIVVTVVKIYLEDRTGTQWLGGSIPSHVFSIILIGFIINAVFVFRWERVEKKTRESDQRN